MISVTLFTGVIASRKVSMQSLCGHGLLYSLVAHLDRGPSHNYTPQEMSCNGWWVESRHVGESAVHELVDMGLGAPLSKGFGRSGVWASNPLWLVEQSAIDPMVHWAAVNVGSVRQQLKQFANLWANVITPAVTPTGPLKVEINMLTGNVSDHVNGPPEQLPGLPTSFL